MDTNLDNNTEVKNIVNENVKTSKEIKKEVKEEKKKNKEENKYKEIIDKLNLESKLKDEKLLRVQAEMQNFKRRKEEETSYKLKYANEDILVSLLPIIDNFERAIKLDDNDLSDEISKFLSGIKMIYTSVLGVLNDNEVKEIPAEGIEFDPKVHQAVLMVHDETKPSGVVLEVLQKGYMFKDKVIRPTMVKVNE